MARAVTRTFDILETISHHPEGIGVNEIARQTDLHKSTVSRLLITLEDLNVVERLDDGSGFAIGPKLQQIAYPANGIVDLVPMTRPYLQNLCSQIGEDIGLAVAKENDVLYVTQVQSEQQAVQVRDWSGSRFAYHVTSSGKLMMAYWPEARLEAYLERPLLPLSEGSITDPGQLMVALDEIRLQNCDWTQGEFADGFSAVSAPIFNAKGQVQAAINIYAPTFRFPAGKEKEITHLILNVSRQLTEKLGGDVEMFD
ncbi:MAG: IclR family transcriptional regulator [Chloroflexota bacterium]